MNLDVPYSSERVLLSKQVLAFQYGFHDMGILRGTINLGFTDTSLTGFTEQSHPSEVNCHSANQLLPSTERRGSSQHSQKPIFTSSFITTTLQAVLSSHVCYIFLKAVTQFADMLNVEHEK